MSNEPNQLISMAEASRLSGYSAEYLSILARKGKLLGEKKGNVWYTTPEFLETYLKSQALRQRGRPQNFLTNDQRPTTNGLHAPATYVHGRESMLPRHSTWKPLALAVPATLVTLLLLGSLELYQPERWNLAQPARHNLAAVSSERSLVSEIFQNVSGFFRSVFSPESSGYGRFIPPEETHFAEEIPTIEVASEDPFPYFDIQSIRRELSDLKSYIRTRNPDSPVVLYSSPSIDLEPIRAAILALDIRPAVTRQSIADADLLGRAVSGITQEGIFTSPAITGGSLTGGTLSGASITDTTADLTTLTFLTATGTSATTTNFFSTNGTFSNLTGTNQTITDLIFTNATGTSATTTNLFSTNASSTNLFFTTGSGGNFTSTGLGTFSNLLLTGSSTLQNLTFVSATGTSATTTNFFSTTASSTNLFSSLLTVGGTGLVVDSSRNVGIGTTTPQGKLEILTAGNSTYPFRIRSSNYSNIFSVYQGSTGYAELDMGRTDGTTQVHISTDGISYFNGGNVGIGTTTPGRLLSLQSPGDAWIRVSTGASPQYWMFGQDGTRKGFEVYDETAAATRFFIAPTTGNVGIGTASPALRLDVNGTIRATGTATNPTTGSGLEIVGTASASELLSYNRDTSSYMPLTLRGSVITLQEAGTDILTVDGGNVGIGTSTPASNLHVQHSGPADGTGLRLTNSSSWQSWEWKTGIVGIENTSLSLRNITSGTTPLVISTAGNVGIGRTAPGARLDITAASNTNSDGLIIRPLNETQTLSLGYGAIKASVGLDIGTVGANDLNLITSNITQMTVTSAGNLKIFSPDLSSREIFFREDNDNTGGILRYDASSNYMQLTTKSGGSNNSGITIGRDTGNVGIGALPSSVYRLLVQKGGNASWTAWFENGGASANEGVAISAGANDNSGTNYHLGFYDGDGDGVGYVTSSAGTVTYGAFTANHDVRVPAEYNATGYPYGTLMCITSLSLKGGWERGLEYNVEACAQKNSGRVLGAYANKYEKEANLHQVYVLGDGHIRVNGEGGDIKAGDHIMISSTAGVGMKGIQSGLSIGIAQEDITFGSPSEEKKVAVQYGLRENYAPALATMLKLSGSSTPEALTQGAMASASSALKAAVTALGNIVVAIYEGAAYFATGIFDKVLAREVKTDILCLTDENGETCVTRAELDAMLANAGTGAQTTSDTSTTDTSTTDSTSSPSTTDTTTSTTTDSTITSPSSEPTPTPSETTDTTIPTSTEGGVGTPTESVGADTTTSEPAPTATTDTSTTTSEPAPEPAPTEPAPAPAPEPAP